jgi:F-type H+/Na+-transporting ATPase subunit beta
VQWWFSRARAKQSQWPAIDPLASRSRMLESNTVSKEHQQVAERVRDVLLRYHELGEQAGSDTLSAEDQRLLARGERIELFLTQPFVVAEIYTDLPGAYLTIEETISSFRDILDGRYDAVPAQSFKFKGKIDQG